MVRIKLGALNCENMSQNGEINTHLLHGNNFTITECVFGFVDSGKLGENRKMSTDTQ